MGTRDIAANITTVVGAATETGEMAMTVNQSAKDLLQESNHLEREVAEFLKDVS